MEQQLTDTLYFRFRDLIQSRCGLHYPTAKRDDLTHNLNLIMRSCQLASLEDLYVAALEAGQVWDTLVGQLTIGETYFFRNAPQFEALRQQILPEIIARRSPLRSLRIWSAGCATGEEPYSLAMLINELLPERENWSVSILATDINQQFLSRAREGLYGEWSFRETSEKQRARFFTREENRWRLRSDIRRTVTFAPLNLVEPVYPSIVNGTCAIDLLVCRNVTIYFDEATTRQIAERFYSALAPGGWLIVGHAEPQSSTYHQFQPHNFPDTTVYRKSLDAPLFAFDPARGTFTSGQAPILGSKSEQPGTSQPAYKGATATSSKPPAASQQPALCERSTIASIEPAIGQAWAAVVARLGQGDKARAEQQARELLHREPTHVEALVLLGRLCADRGDWKQARQQCEQALVVDPLAVEAHYILAQINEHEGQLDAALAAYRRGIYLDRNFVLAALGMANVWRQMGQFAEARRRYLSIIRQLSELPPQSSVAGSSDTTVAEVIGLAQKHLQRMSIS